MITKLFTNNIHENLFLFLKELDRNPEVNSIMILAGDKVGLYPEKVNGVLKEIKKPIFGGTFPGIIYQTNKYEDAVLVVGFPFESRSIILKNISKLETNVLEVLRGQIQIESLIKTYFVFVDGLAKNISRLIDSLFSAYGLEFNYIGGGAGSLSLNQKPCIFTNEGLLEDAAIITGIGLQSSIGVKHGWLELSNSYKVTKVRETVIDELDYKPAFEVYKDAIYRYSGKEINKDNFFSIAKAFPFGISKIGAETVVRDPITVDNNSIICVGEIEIGSFVKILNGKKETLLNAAEEAAIIASEGHAGGHKKFSFFVDCISRVLFLDQDFNQELENVHRFVNDVPFFGVLSLGEIANNGNDYLEFYNKTAVVACFYDNL